MNRFKNTQNLDSLFIAQQLNNIRRFTSYISGVI